MKQQLLSVKNVRNVLNQVINPLDEAEIILSKNVTSSHDFKSLCGGLRPDANDWCLHFIMTFDPSDINMLCLNQVELTACWIRVMKFMGYRFDQYIAIRKDSDDVNVTPAIHFIANPLLEGGVNANLQNITKAMHEAAAILIERYDLKRENKVLPFENYIPFKAIMKPNLAPNTIYVDMKESAQIDDELLDEYRDQINESLKLRLLSTL